MSPVRSASQPFSPGSVSCASSLVRCLRSRPRFQLSLSLATRRAVAPVLSLQDAITIARRNNPLFLQTRSARQRAGAALRSSYGVLLPDVSSQLLELVS